MKEFNIQEIKAIYRIVLNKNMHGRGEQEYIDNWLKYMISWYKE